MILKLKQYHFDVSKEISISIRFTTSGTPNAFHAPNLKINPVETEHFIGSTKKGGSLNFKNLFINPHGNGTHTECVGHISNEDYFICDCLNSSIHLGQLISIKPETLKGDRIINKTILKEKNIESDVNTLIIRTYPNKKTDKIKDWSNTNPPFFSSEAIELLLEKNIEHLIVDLPSIDKEIDGGLLNAHHTFWNYPSNNVRKNATITEMVYIPNNIKDDIYAVSIQTLPIELDASPSKIILYNKTDI